MHFTDQLHRIIQIEKPVERIVSLVPSQTEFLCDIGLGEKLVGVTNYCVHPKNELKKISKIGGTKKLQIDKIKSLKPQLIIANKEENNKADINNLEKNFPVWISDIKTVEDACKMMEQLGEIFDKKIETDSILSTIKKNFLALNTKSSHTCAYVIWENPLMVAGAKTFINHLLNISGFVNVYEKKSRYPETTIDELNMLKPDFLFLSSEPFPFRNKHKIGFENALNCKVILVDGEMFSWYGSRMRLFPDYIAELQKNIDIQALK